MAIGRKPSTPERERTVLVTGGAGFIGSHLVRRAARAGYRVVNLDKLTYAGNLESLHDVADLPNYRFVHGDVADRKLVRDLVVEIEPDVVFHLAAESHVDRSIDEPADFVLTNLVGTFVLLEASLAAWLSYERSKKESFRFVHVSTDEVFGQLGPEGFFTERTAYDPSSPYSASKAGGDHLVRAWNRTYRLPVIVTNCSNNFGPFQHPEKFIPTIIHNALSGSDIPIYGKGQHIRDWIFVEDHVDGLFKAADAGVPGATYLFGGGAALRNDELCRLVCAALDAARPAKGGKKYKDQITFVEDRPGHDLRYAIDSAASNTVLGWSAVISLERGLERTVEWYLRHPDWFARDTAQLKRLGLARKVVNEGFVR
jgi:dTDP-glucose 4,6-dehydratase